LLFIVYTKSAECDIQVGVHIRKYKLKTEHNEWNDDDEIEMLSPQIEGRLHLEYTYIV